LKCAFGQHLAYRPRDRAPASGGSSVDAQSFEEQHRTRDRRLSGDVG